jgi:TolB-like protein
MRIRSLPPFVFTLLLLAVSAAFPQSPPLIAVLPLRAPEGVSAEQAGAITRLLETGLVKSSAYQVVERSEISQLLAAQKLSSEAIFDESSAVRLGKLLSARLIVLGTLSRLDQRLFLMARIIDVATGRTLRAEYEEGDSLEGIARSAESLGLRLGSLPQDSELLSGAEPPAASSRERLLEQKRALENELAREAGRARRLRTGSWVLYGVSGALALAAGATLAGGLSQPEASSAAPCFRFSLSFAILGGAGAIVGTALRLERPDLGDLQGKIERLEEEIHEEEQK